MRTNITLGICLFLVVILFLGICIRNGSQRKFKDWRDNPAWVAQAERMNRGEESGVTWKEGVEEESYDPEKEEISLVDEKGIPQGYDSMGTVNPKTGKPSRMFVGVPKGCKLIRSPKNSSSS